MLQLVLGGARSGKSRFAENQAKQSGLEVIYIATAQALDDEMRSRIQHHIDSRPPWPTVEEPIALAEALVKEDAAGRFLLVDCLTLWLTNLLLAEDGVFEREVSAFISVLPTLQANVVLVSNEVGLGVIPMGELSRKYVDEAGRLNQRIAEIADKVTFCAAGLPLTLKA